MRKAKTTKLPPGRPIERTDVAGVKRREYERRRMAEPAYHEAKMKNYHRIYAERRELLLMLKGTICWDCGQEFPPEQIHFHHRNPLEKLFEVSKGLMRPLPIFLAECRKCDRLCRRCHHLRHHPKKA